MENLFKEHLQNTIVPTTVRHGNVEYIYFLSYIKDLDSCESSDCESSCVYECLDHITDEPVAICVKDVVGFEESSLYQDDTDKDREHTENRIAEDRKEYRQIHNDNDNLTYEELYSAVKHYVPIEVDISEEALRAIATDYIKTSRHIKTNYLMWYYDKYFNIDLSSDDIDESLDVLKSIWKDQLDIHKQTTLTYLDTEISKCDTNEEKEAVMDIRELISSTSFHEEVDAMETFDSLSTHWPSILLPAPKFVRRPNESLIDDVYDMII